jgi:hypothetical protein
MKAPSTNIQAPEKLQTPNFNSTAGKLNWMLKFGTSPDVGAWNLELKKCSTT